MDTIESLGLNPSKPTMSSATSPTTSHARRTLRGIAAGACAVVVVFAAVRSTGGRTRGHVERPSIQGPQHSATTPSHQGNIEASSTAAPTPSTRAPGTIAREGTHTISVVHPSWGPIRIVTHQNDRADTFGSPGPGPASITVIDSHGTIRRSWKYSFMYDLRPVGTDPDADHQYGTKVLSDIHAIDKLGHVFIVFNPGRYNGIIVLSMTRNGIENFNTLPTPPDGYNPRFYGAQVVDTNHNGIYEIQTWDTQCQPSCAQGPTTTTTFRWNRTDYVPGRTTMWKP